MWRTLESYGIEPSALYQQVGLDLPDSVTNQDRIQAVAMQKLWRLAEETTGDKALGIAFAKHANPMALHGLGFSVDGQ